MGASEMEVIKKQLKSLLEGGAGRALEDENIIDNNFEAGASLPVFYFQGWGETGKFIREVYFEEIYKNKKRVVAVDYPRKVKIEIKNKVKEISRSQFQRVIFALEAIKRRGLKKVVGVGYSQGAIDLAMATSIRPDLFQGVVFLNPIGSTGAMPYWNLVKRFIVKNGRQNYLLAKRKPQLKMKFSQIKKSVWSYVNANPVLLVQESISIARNNLFDYFGDIRKCGIKIALICSQHDRVYKLSRVKEKIKSFKPDFFYCPEGGHTNIKFSKEARATLLRAIEDIGNR